MDVRRLKGGQLMPEIDKSTASGFYHAINQRTGDITDGALALISLPKSASS